MAYEVNMARFVGVISALTLAVMSACSDDDGSLGGSTGGTGGMDTDAGTDSGTGGAPTNDAASDGQTPPGGECTGDCQCDMGETCDFACAMGCFVQCLGATCTADCPEGGCTLDADFEAEADYTCSGGGCTFDCDTASSCNIDCSGGGCNVGCDGNSTCTVTCGAGDPCTVSCAEGATATCTGDNCELQNCAMCDPTPDATYMPMIDPANFTNVVDNPLFPLPIGASWTYDAPDEVITVTVTDMQKTVMGVDVVVVHDQVCSTTEDLVMDACMGGDLIEDTFDWYAQDADGNVWYFGETTAEYVDGMVATTAGSWEAGVDGALPGIIMHATHRRADIGTQYRQEYYPCEAEDMGEIIAVNESVTVPTGTYNGCVVIRDFSPLDPTANEHKTFCPGIGVVLVIDVMTMERVEELTTMSGL